MILEQRHEGGAMKLSIITVNLNNRDGLQKTINSVVAQTFRDFEWIVIDGGSTDGSKDLIEQYAEHFAYWVSEPDKGIYNAMNKGIKVAKGEYLQFLNSGDWLCDETALERSFSHGFTADIAYGNLYFVFPDGKKEKSNFPDPMTLGYLYHDSIGHSASFIKRDLFQTTLYDENFRIVSDWAFYLRCALENKEFVFIDETVTCFDMSGISSVNAVLVEQERSCVIKRDIPDAVVRDYQKMDEMESLLKKDQVKKVLSYGTEKKLYHKMITGCLELIGLLDRLRCKKQK